MLLVAWVALCTLLPVATGIYLVVVVVRCARARRLVPHPPLLLALGTGTAVTAGINAAVSGQWSVLVAVCGLLMMALVVDQVGRRRERAGRSA